LLSMTLLQAEEYHHRGNPRRGNVAAGMRAKFTGSTQARQIRDTPKSRIMNAIGIDALEDFRK